MRYYDACVTGFALAYFAVLISITVALWRIHAVLATT